jgi:hypothetical protein
LETLERAKAGYDITSNDVEVEEVIDIPEG